MADLQAHSARRCEPASGSLLAQGHLPPILMQTQHFCAPPPTLGITAIWGTFTLEQCKDTHTIIFLHRNESLHTYKYTQHKYNSRHLHLLAYPSNAHLQEHSLFLALSEESLQLLHQVIQKPRKAAPQCGCRVHMPHCHLSHYFISLIILYYLWYCCASLQPQPSSATSALFLTCLLLRLQSSSATSHYSIRITRLIY